MADFTFPTGNTGANPTVSRTANILMADSTNVGSALLSAALGQITWNDFAHNQILYGGQVGALPVTDVRNFGAPVGNGSNSYSALSIVGDTAVAADREFLFMVGLNNKSGVATTATRTDKVAIYSGIVNTASGASGWALNTVTLVASSYGGAGAVSGTKTCYGYELDFNNSNRDTSADFSNPYIGMAITGASDFANTAGLSFSGAGSVIPGNHVSQWQRGIVFDPGWTINDVAIEDRSNSKVILRAINGADGLGFTTRVLGLDFANADFSSGAIALKKGNSIFWTNGSSTASDLVDVTGNRFVGSGGAAVFTGGIACAPDIDNHASSGTSSNRWTNVFSVNGTVQTSDINFKKNITSLPSTLNLIQDITPVTFNWKTGDTRTHWGFIAQDVKSAMEKHNMGDFGGHVESEQGQSLRPDQLIPILWNAVKELSNKIEMMQSYEKTV